MPVAAIADWLITAGSVTLALGAIWHWWGAPVQKWIRARVEGAEARLVGIEEQAKEQVRLLAIANGSIKTTETRVNEIVSSLEERKASIDPLIASIGERVVSTDAVLKAHIIEAAPMLRAFNAEHPPPAPTTPIMPPLGSPSLPSQEKE